MIFKVFTQKNTIRYENILPDILYNYNHTPHSSTGFTPEYLAQENLPEEDRLKAVQNLRNAAMKMIEFRGVPKLKYTLEINDYVRILQRTLEKNNIFKKKYHPQWS